MASNTLIIKCKTEAGPYTLKDLTADSTVKDLKSSLQKLSQIRPEVMKILCGYPPKPLGNDKDGSKLGEVNISSGDTIIIETLKIPEMAAICPIVKPGAIVNPGGPPTISKAQELDELMFAQCGILMRHVVPSDNSCLFNSVYFILSSGDFDGKKSNDMRQIIATAVRNNPEKYNSAFLGKENLEYCAWILDSNHWGGAIELSILSEHFKLEIVAVDTISLRMHRFGESDNYTQRIFLIYDGIHYDPLVLELENAKQTIFAVSDTKVMDMAMELAKEAKSSRQFTDVANFSVACQVCKVKLRGEKEALEHAKSTGHNNFGEV